MSRTPGAIQSRRRPRQGTPEVGRSRARSIAPVVVLGTCMIAVLYGNVSYYSESLHNGQHSARSETPGIEGHQQSASFGNAPQPSKGDQGGPGGHDISVVDYTAGDRTDQPAPKAPLPEEEQLPKPPIAAEGGEAGVATAAAVVAVEREGEGDGGVQELDRWDDDAGGTEEHPGGSAVQSLTVGGANVEPESVAPGGIGGDSGGVDGGDGGGEDGVEDSGGVPDKGDEDAAALFSLLNEEGIAASGSSGSREGEGEGEGEGEREGEQGGEGREHNHGKYEGEREGDSGSGDGGDGGGSNGGVLQQGEEKGALSSEAAAWAADEEVAKENGDGVADDDRISVAGDDTIEEGTDENGDKVGGVQGQSGETGGPDKGDREPGAVVGDSSAGVSASRSSSSSSSSSKVPAEVLQEGDEEGGTQGQSVENGAPEGVDRDPTASSDNSSAGVSASRSSSSSSSSSKSSGVPRVEADGGAGGEEEGEGVGGPRDGDGGSPEGDSSGGEGTGIGNEGTASNSKETAAGSEIEERGGEEVPQTQQERLTSVGGAPTEAVVPGDGGGENAPHPELAPGSTNITSNSGVSPGEQAEQHVEPVEVMEVEGDAGKAGDSYGAYGVDGPKKDEGDRSVKNENNDSDGNVNNDVESGDGDVNGNGSGKGNGNGDGDGNGNGDGDGDGDTNANEETVVAGAINNGAVQGAMECASTKLGEGADNIVNIATWKDVPGDWSYRNPLAEENGSRYVTLQKDLGGFNNIRLSLECGVAFAAATGRTFVIPPPFTIWNMNDKKQKKEVDLRELFSFDKLRASGRVRVITTQEFLEREASPGNLVVRPGKDVMNLDVKAVTAYMEAVAEQYEGGLPEMKVERAALVMPRRKGEKVDLEDEAYAFAKEWLYGRRLLEYQQGEGWEQAKVIHWRAREARLLAPFYAFVLHADEVSERYHKRLLRDLLHYPEEVYCKASQIISLLRQEDPSGEFSTFHVRRNDFLGMYKMVNIPLGEVIANSVDHLKENEVVYVATDETDLSAFEPFKKYIRVKFLADYYDRAGVSEMNPNLIGMLDQIVASHGRTFTGCWLSTFTAYILRLRGHLQKPRESNWTYYNPRKKYHHEYKLPENPLWMTEWPFGWEGIDETGVPDATAP